MLQPNSYHFEVINKRTPNYLSRIGKPELTMLIHMLEDLEHGNLSSTLERSGYQNGAWDEAKLANYKLHILKPRMEEEGYSFFTLRDTNGHLIALASGNASDNKSQLRLLNFAVDRDHRLQGVGTELMKQVSNYAATHGYQRIVMPLSHHAIEKNNIAIYQNMVKNLGIDVPDELFGTGGLRPHAIDQDSVEFVLKPKRFIAIGILEQIHQNMNNLLSATGFARV